MKTFSMLKELKVYLERERDKWIIMTEHDEYISENVGNVLWKLRGGSE